MQLLYIIVISSSISITIIILVATVLFQMYDVYHHDVSANQRLKINIPNECSAIF